MTLVASWINKTNLGPIHKQVETTSGQFHCNATTQRATPSEFYLCVANCRRCRRQFAIRPPTNCNDEEEEEEEEATRKCVRRPTCCRHRQRSLNWPDGQRQCDNGLCWLACLFASAAAANFSATFPFERQPTIIVNLLDPLEQTWQVCLPLDGDIFVSLSLL